MREVKSIYLDLCNIGIGHIGAYMEKLDNAIVVRNWIYDSYKSDRVCKIYHIDPDTNKIYVDDNPDESNVHGEPLHGYKYGRCPVTPKRVFEQLVRFSPRLGLRELEFFAIDENRTKHVWNEKTMSYDDDITFVFKVPGQFEKYEINVRVRKDHISIGTHD